MVATDDERLGARHVTACMTLLVPWVPHCRVIRQMRQSRFPRRALTNSRGPWIRSRFPRELVPVLPPRERSARAGATVTLARHVDDPSTGGESIPPPPLKDHCRIPEQ